MMPHCNMARLASTAARVHLHCAMQRYTALDRAMNGRASTIVRLAAGADVDADEEGRFSPAGRTVLLFGMAA
jgi:hypothetical protein